MFPLGKGQNFLNKMQMAEEAFAAGRIVPIINEYGPSDQVRQGPAGTEMLYQSSVSGDLEDFMVRNDLEMRTYWRSTRWNW